MFEWIEKIGCTVRGNGQDLLISLPRRPSLHATRELVALFRRYELDMSVLEVLKRPSNVHLF